MMWLLLAIIPLDLPLTDRVETCEHQIVYDEHGKEILQQAIVWRWNKATCRDEVQAWWLLKDDSFSRDMLRMDGGKMRRIVADRVYVRHSQFDAELVDRQRLPVEERRGLVDYKREVE